MRFLIIAVIAATAFLFSSASGLVFDLIKPKEATNQTSITSDPLAYMDVYVDGEVNQSGTYQLPPGATLQQLIDLAGGITSEADQLCYLPDYQVLDGQSYYIPAYREGKVSINAGDTEELLTLPGIGLIMADRIIDHRFNFGAFNCLEELLNVSGFTSITFQRVRDWVRL